MNRAQLNKSTNIPFEIELNDNVADERFIADGMTEFERNGLSMRQAVRVYGRSHASLNLLMSKKRGI